MDTTLRDGEQTSGISFSSSEKLTISKLLLEELLIDRIETEKIIKYTTLELNGI